MQFENGATVDEQALLASRSLIRGHATGSKILGGGELKNKLNDQGEQGERSPPGRKSKKRADRVTLK